MRPVRNSAKAIILEDGQLLVVQKLDGDGAYYYILPGGGQVPGETLAEALRRECREELGADVRVGDLTLVREYIGRNHEFAERDVDFHQIEFMFECTLSAREGVGTGHLLDDGQVGVAWLPLAELEGMQLYPAALRSLLARRGTDRGRRPASVVYLGDVN
jgi:8-oxo-dGTP diphosphatase